jgi:NADH:ubiquinone oxidoreductase subunit D
VPFDVRSARSYWVYPELEFDGISHEAGDVHARYLQRFAEMKQSIHLMDQIVDKLPHGSVQAQVPGIRSVVPHHAGHSAPHARLTRGRYGGDSGRLRRCHGWRGQAAKRWPKTF